MKKIAVAFLLVVSGISVASGSSLDLVDADFEGFTAGQAVPVQYTPRPTDRPFELYPGKITYTVEDETTFSGSCLESKFMRIVGSPVSADSASFGPKAAYDSGRILFSWDALFETYEGYFFEVLGRTSSGNWLNLAKVYTSQIAGEDRMLVTKQADTYTYWEIGTYSTDSPMHFESLFDLDNDTWTLSIDGELKFTTPLPTDSVIGDMQDASWFPMFTAGVAHDPDNTVTPQMQVDNVKISIVPEPMTMLAFGSAVAGIGGYIRRRRRA